MIHDRKDLEVCQSLAAALGIARDTLTSYATRKDSIINSFLQLDSVRKVTIGALTSQVKVSQDQFHLTEARNNTLETDLKKQKIKTLEVAGVGIVVSVSLLILLVKK